MRWFKILNVVALLTVYTVPLASAQTVSYAGSHPEFETALSDCSGLPCIEALTAQGQTVRLAVDTGNPTSFSPPGLQPLSIFAVIQKSRRFRGALRVSAEME